jgi:hypothetical protein
MADGDLSSPSLADDDLSSSSPADSDVGEATIRAAARIRQARIQARGGVLGNASPTGWWPVGGSDVVVAGRRRAPPCVDFFFFCFVCRASQLRRTANNVGRRLQGMLDVVSNVPSSVAFFLSCAGRDTRQRLLTVCFLGRRTTKGLYGAKICRVPFAVRLVENAWQSLCRVFSSLCRAPETHGKALFSRSGCLIYFVPMEWSGCPYPYPSRQNHLFHKDTKCSIFCKY